MLHEEFISCTIGERPLYSWWDQHQLISRLERAHYETAEEEETIWAVVVQYQAFYLADWMVADGSDATGRPWESCIPYDASKWNEWIESRLMISSSGVSDNYRKETIKEMVKRKYITIPLNSGLPLCYWLSEGYEREDFCDVYSCIVYFRDAFSSGDYTEEWEISCYIKECLDSYMDECIKAGTALYMARAISESDPEVAQQYSGKVLAKLVENMYRKYRDRKQSVSATKIQCAFRVYHSSKRVNVLRSHPDNLFSNFSALRKRKLSIDDTRFGAVVQ
ncbi:unnamed protein product [Ectocarpus sp. 12 AP-2014]